MTTAAEAARSADRVNALKIAGARVAAIEQDCSFLSSALAALASDGVSSMTVEGGPTLHRAIWQAALVDKVQLFVAGHAIGPMSVVSLPDLADVSLTPLGEDVLIEGYVHGAD